MSVKQQLQLLIIYYVCRPPSVKERPQQRTAALDNRKKLHCTFSAHCCAANLRFLCLRPWLWCIEASALLNVLDCRFDGILCEHAAMQLDRRQTEVLCDVAVANS